MKSNDPPEVIIGMSRELAKFLIENCDSNISVGLSSLQLTTSKENAERLVKMIEQFKELKQATEKGMRE